MKDKLTGKIKYQAGFSTLEIMLAFVILILTLTAVIMVAFGNQSTSIDSQTNNEALYKAQKQIEDMRASASLDFNLVNPRLAVSDDIYMRSVDVTNVDFYTKKVTSNVSWNPAGGRTPSVQLVTLITNPRAVNSGSTCSSVLTGDWTQPSKQDYKVQDLVGDTSSGFPLTGIDVKDEKLYVTVNNTNGNNGDRSFFIFDISDPGQPLSAPIGILDNNPAKKDGLSAVTVGGNYAYVANAYSANFTTCLNPSGANPSCAEFQVIDISNPSSPSLKYSLKLPGVIGSQTRGKSIFYKDNYVYLGLTSTGPGNGPEFHIIDVNDPLNPVEVGSWPPSASDINNDINAIYVRGNYAYLAHPAENPYNEQLTVLDISNPANPQRVSGFYDNGSSGGNGKSLFPVGNKLYFGRTATKLSGQNDTLAEFYILDNSTPTAIPATPLGSLALDVRVSVNNLLIRDFLAFLITTTEFQIWNLTNQSSITQWAAPLILPGGQSAAADCEGNYIFVGSNDNNDKGWVSVITGQ